MSSMLALLYNLTFLACAVCLYILLFSSGGGPRD